MNRYITEITIDGETHSVTEWADMYGLYPSTIRSRYKDGARGYEILEPLYKDKLNTEFVHYRGGGVWVYTGKKTTRNLYKKNLKWVYTGIKAQGDDKYD